MSIETIRKAWLISELQAVSCLDCEGRGTVDARSGCSTPTGACLECKGTGRVQLSVSSLTARVKDDVHSIDYDDEHVRISAEDFDLLYCAYRNQLSQTKTIREKSYALWQSIDLGSRPEWHEPTTVEEALETLDDLCCLLFRMTGCLSSTKPA